MQRCHWIQAKKRSNSHRRAYRLNRWPSCVVGLLRFERYGAIISMLWRRSDSHQRQRCLWRCGLRVRRSRSPSRRQKFTAFFPCWSRFYFRSALHTSVTSTHLPSSHRNTHTTAYDMVAWSFLSYSCISCALAFSQLVIVLNGTACTTGIWPANVTISSAPLIVSILLLRDFFYFNKPFWFSSSPNLVESPANREF